MSGAHMARAIELAVQEVTIGRARPFAALVVKGGLVIAEGTNVVPTSLDPTAHAEMVAIRNACRNLGVPELGGCDIYTTCEPCLMCIGAIFWAKISRVFYGCTRHDAASAGFDDAPIYKALKLPPASRSIPFICLMRSESHAPFDVWRAQATLPSGRTDDSHREH